MPTLVDYLGLILSPAGSPAMGDIPVRGASGGWTTIPIGSAPSGSVLAIDAVTRLPVWGAASGGGGAVSSVFGRTGAIVANTNDYSVAQVTGAAPLASPAFTGTPTTTTPTPGDNSTKIASTAFVQSAISGGNVSSVFGRTGAVVTAVGDYLAVPSGGLTGATASTRFVGGTGSGAPASGTFNTGDFVVDQSGSIWICTAAGTPGTWTRVYTPITTVFGRTGAVTPGNADYLAAAAGGLPGATAATRFVGGTVSGAPTSGTFAKGDFIVDQSGSFWICTTAGTPGTWTQATGGTGGAVSSVFGRTGAVTAAANDYTAAQVTNAADKSSASQQGFTGEVRAPDFTPAGLTGATAATRYVGGTASGAPTTGTFAVGDYVIDRTGFVWICTTAGSPGTWTQSGGGGGGAVSSVFSRTGAVVSQTGDYTAAQVTNAADKSSASQQLFSGEIKATDFFPSGLPGATAASRFAGGTISGAPTTGTFAKGDWILDQSGFTWICTTAGTPGTWKQSGDLVNPMTTAADLIVATTGGAPTRLPIGTTGQMLLVRSDGTLVYYTPTAISAKAWGVTANGSTNDSPFLQNAVNATPSTGGAVDLPPGTIMLTTGITLPQPTPTAGIYDNPIRFTGAGPNATVLKKQADVILIDNSGSVSAGTVTMRRGIILEHVTLDGNNTGSQPLIRNYYMQNSRFNDVTFRNNNGGSAMVFVQAWDSYFKDIWVTNCGGTTPTIDQAWNSGTSQNGNEAIRILSAQQYPQVGTSTMGYSTDNCNNLWFTNLNMTNTQVGAIYVGQVDPGNSAPHRIYFTDTKFEASALLGPFVRMYGAHYINFHNTNFNAINLGTGVTSIDLVHFANVSATTFSGQTYVQANGTYTASRWLSLFGGNDDINLDGDINGAMSSGGTSVAPFNITGRTTAGNNGFSAGVDFNGTNTNCRIRAPRGLTLKNTPADLVLDGAEKKIVLVGASTNTTVTMAATPLAFAIGASETWTAEFFLSVTGSTAGMKFDIDGPAAPTQVEIWWEGSTSAIATTGVERTTAIDTATATAFASASITGRVRVNVTFRNGTTAGTVTLRFAAVTATQSNSINSGSYMTARRVS